MPGQSVEAMLNGGRHGLPGRPSRADDVYPFQRLLFAQHDLVSGGVRGAGGPLPAGGGCRLYHVHTCTVPLHPGEMREPSK